MLRKKSAEICSRRFQSTFEIYKFPLHLHTVEFLHQPQCFGDTGLGLY